jgi:hypothetical protein
MKAKQVARAWHILYWIGRYSGGSDNPIRAAGQESVHETPEFEGDNNRGIKPYGQD